ncbi:hypothetical protein [Clostridium homopropionicum]|nr:hypothetical protein [Clostridium homopropionicum]
MIKDRNRRKMRRIFKIDNAQLTIDNEGCFAKAKLDFILQQSCNY